jgi:hypothetical protein
MCDSAKRTKGLLCPGRRRGDLNGFFLQNPWKCFARSPNRAPRRYVGRCESLLEVKPEAGSDPGLGC